MSKLQTRINDQIRVPQIRLVGADGEQLGIVATEDALKRALGAACDLVEVAPNEDPPVCRIMDYGKYKYQRNKKVSKGHVHHTKTKEIRLRPKTGVHDIDFKVKQAIQFLKHKDKVQISVVFRGREIAHVQEGHRVMAGVVEGLMEHGKVETSPAQQGRRIVCTVAPK
ncbi:MAG: translation initiation factor IF-3 [Planctomycetaceae bacterium]|nr:translation initiation factor IF-3 [Planctomycetaceae bacterium]MBP63832.1 translation initiation factor IF-3 [Planctomycetaceae bacterium]